MVVLLLKVNITGRTNCTETFLPFSMPGTQRGAKSVRLSSREASILSALVRSHGKVVSSRSLLLDIWGDDSYYNLRSLNVYVSKLRSMLHADSSVEIISERGIGYKLCVDKSRKNAK